MNCLNKKQNQVAEIQQPDSAFVELEGVEPSSKRGSHTLSTCLSLPSVFERRQDQSHQPAP